MTGPKTSFALARGGVWGELGWQIPRQRQVRPHHDASIHPQIPLSIEYALSDLARYLDADSGHVLSHTAQHRPVLEALVSAATTARGNFMHDVHYAALLREHGVTRIYTADSDFEKFSFLEVIDPTAAGPTGRGS